MALTNQVANVYSAGLRSVGSYQVSGVPWVTGSNNSTTYLTNGKLVRFQFPNVTKSITVINTGGEVFRLHFQKGTGGSSVALSGSDGDLEAGASNSDVMSGHHYITVPANNGSVTMDIKCKEIYLSNHSGGNTGYEIFAELTNIPTGSMYALTGSGITG